MSRATIVIVLKGVVVALILAVSPWGEAQMGHQTGQASKSPHRIQLGNPAVGKELFKQKGCVTCHAVKGEGGKIGPDLSKTQHTHNVYTMAAIMWNHAPQMGEAMERERVKRPEFKGDEMAHLVSYLHSLEVIGDPAKGKALFTSKRCVQCHAIDGEGGKIGPDLGRIPHPHPPIEMVGVMWNHSPTMTAMMGALGIPRPVFEGNEMADLLAYLEQVQGGSAPPKQERPHGH